MLNSKISLSQDFILKIIMAKNFVGVFVFQVKFSPFWSNSALKVKMYLFRWFYVFYGQNSFVFVFWQDYSTFLFFDGNLTLQEWNVHANSWTFFSYILLKCANFLSIWSKTTHTHTCTHWHQHDIFHTQTQWGKKKEKHKACSAFKAEGTKHHRAS